MVRRSPNFVALAIAGSAAVVLLAVPAAAAISDWSSGAKAKIRLLAAGVGEDGQLSAAIEITLPPGWETYWRFPGDSGVAPAFDFSASHNLGVSTVAFPLPKRVIDASLTSNVYTGDVVFPVTATVLDPRSPINLAVSVDLGVCQTVCVTDHAEAHLLVPVGKADPTAANEIANARLDVPGPPQPGVLAVDSVSRTGGPDSRPTFNVTITAPDAANATLFVETPVDWFPDTPTLVSASGTTATYSVGADRRNATTPFAGATFRVTIAAGAAAIDQTVPLQ